jgi:hypothetical protein
MNLIKRLLFANALAVIIPVIITVLISAAVFFIDSNISGKRFSLENYQKLAKIKLELAGDPNSILRVNPELIGEKFSKRTAGSIICHSGRIHSFAG